MRKEVKWPKRWWVALAAGVAVVLPALTLFRLPSASVEVPAKSPVVQVTSLNAASSQKVIEEQAQFFDPTPLFLPTRWNASQRELPASVQRQPDEVFGAFPAKLSDRFREAELSLSLRPKIELPAGPRDVLAHDDHEPVYTFGRLDVSVPKLPGRVGFAEVRKAATGELVFGQELAAASPVKIEWGFDVRPPEYMAAVDRAGLVGPLVVVTGSGSDELDGYYRDFLAQKLRLGERLGPGFYRIVVGP